MKRISSLWKHPYIGRVGILLIAIALVVGVLSCINPINPYLTMTVIPVGGGTTTPPSGPQIAGASVRITASALDNYQFASWNATMGTFGFPINIPINFAIMPNIDSGFTAYFVKGDHFKCYTVVNSSYIGKVVSLKDQFVTVNATVTWAQFFGNPAQKLHNNVTTNISNPNNHLTVYNITTGSEPQTWQVEVVNQFGVQNLIVSGPVALAVPTWKLTPGNHTPPVGLDHFLLYKVIGGYMNVTVGLNDEFDKETQVLIYRPLFFANPVQKTYGDGVTNITDNETHLVFYGIEAGNFWQVVQVNNQFGNQTLLVGNPALLAVPSLKLSWQLPHP